MYLTYDEYVQMGGNVDAALYPRLEYKARKKIDYYTQNRIQALEDVPEAVKMCMFELIQLLAQSTSDEPIIQSESNNGVSVSYKVMTEQEQNAKAAQIIREYLPPELLYLGK